MVDPNNHENALKSLFTDMRQLVNYCNEFLNDFVRVMALRHGKDLSPLETITIGNPPDINNVTLPYFLSKPI
jgi:hypothetical protein